MRFASNFRGHPAVPAKNGLEGVATLVIRHDDLITAKLAVEL